MHDRTNRRFWKAIRSFCRKGRQQKISRAALITDLKIAAVPAAHDMLSSFGYFHLPLSERLYVNQWKQMFELLSHASIKSITPGQLYEHLYLVARGKLDAVKPLYLQPTYKALLPPTS